MANFEAPVLYNAVTTTFKTAGFLWAVSRREMIYEIEMGQFGAYASTDAPMIWDLSRGATPTLAGSTVAANTLDIGDTAVAAGLFINAATAEFTPTTAGNGLALKQWGINQRGSYRWRALDDGDNIVIPATAGVGVGLRCASITAGYASSAVGSISFIER
jgi:hypothetical protein